VAPVAPTAIKLSPATYHRLGTLLATPDDTFEAVITRLLDTADQRPIAAGKSRQSGGPIIDAAGVATFGPTTAINLTHTVPRGGTLNDAPLQYGGRWGQPTWNSLVAALVRHALGHHDRTSPEFQNRMRFTPFEPGRATRSGYLWFPDLDMTLRQSDAIAAWRSAIALTQGETLVIEFDWLDRRGAARPGQKGRLVLV
jgi:hypothetical protein